MNAYIVPEERHVELSEKGIVICTALCSGDVYRNVCYEFVDDLEEIEIKEDI